MADSTRPLKVLMLHGYRQNATSCREKSGAFRKVTKKLLDPVFISAPLFVPQDPTSTPEQETPDAKSDERGWWFSGAEADTFNASESSPACRGFQQCLQTLSETARQQGPFDGILGFSQGAAMAALLCALLQRKELDWSFQFAILVAGFRSRAEPHQYLLCDRITLPSLHVFGDTDRVIPSDMSEALLELFADATVIRHPGGHHIPAGSQLRPAYTEFLTKMQTLCTASGKSD